MSRAFVGLSGGVDSAVSAALLNREGHEVTGVFIRIWQPEFKECTWEKDRMDAMRVCVALGIPFREIDLSAEYEREVVKDMTACYERGITPNPDIRCNEKIKFGVFYDWSRAQGADVIATGHYAQIGTAGELRRGLDEDKDQSYFLYRVSREHLPFVRFPVGGLRKETVRTYAKRFDLPVAEKRDSQGLCFVGDVSIEDFLKRYIRVEKGAVLNMRGEVVGEHHGASLYTIGQRHGFSVIDTASTPHYVQSIDTYSNSITVTTDVRDCFRDRASLSDMHYLGDALPRRMLAQSRYREKPFYVSLSTHGDRTIVTFEEPRIISPGQSLVLYANDRCLGGGIIAQL